MARGVKRKEGEDHSEATITKVIEALEQEKPITKKVACEMLKITYNTTRLGTIISQHKAKIEHRTAMRKKMRTTPMTVATESEIVSGYLSGESLVDLSNSTFRSTAVVKRVLKKFHVPIRNSSIDYFHPVFIEDEEAIADDYVEGDLVYLARYGCPATITGGESTDKYGMVYGAMIAGVNRKHVYQPYFELADLRKVQTELKITMKDLNKEEVNNLIAEGLINQKKQMDKRK